MAYIDENFREDINIQKIEEVCFYSYRSINRIFEALHNETIGKYIKRLRLEKAAQFLKYSDIAVADIGYEVGFEDRAAFSKAFKNRYGCSPSSFRNSNQATREMIQEALEPEKGAQRDVLQYEIEMLPAFDFLYLEYRGDCENIPAMEGTWQKLTDYTSQNGLLNHKSIFLTEIMDDAEISDHIHSRYNQGFILEKPLTFEPEGLFKIRSHERQKYAKFIYRGDYEGCFEFYHRIYAFWMLDVPYELVDKPFLEFYPNFEDHLPSSELITEIYIPVR